MGGDDEKEFILRTLLSGGIAGSVAKTVVAPLDRVKIHFQVRNPSYEPFIGQYVGVFKAIRTTYTQHGFTELFRGHNATLARVFPYAAINFMAFEQFKQLFGIPRKHTKGDQIPPWKRILSGSLAGCTAVSCTYPFDIIRARVAYAASHRQPSSGSIYREAVKMLWTEGIQNSRWGIVGFYQGYLPTMLGIIPYAGTSFFVFETLKNHYIDHYDHDAPQHLRLLMGMCAGICAQTVTYPLDVIRRRSQLWRIANHLPPSNSFTPAEMYRMTSGLLRSGGIRELFIGLSINYLKVAPSMGISFVTYDFLKEHIK